MEHWLLSLQGHNADLYLLEQADGSLMGAVASDEYGTAQLTDAVASHSDDKKIRTIAGRISLGGHTANLKATDDGKSMGGSVRLNLFVGSSFGGLRQPDVKVSPIKEKPSAKS